MMISTFWLLVFFWFLFGFCMSIAVYSQTGKLDRHLWVRNLFFITLILLGPLTLLVCFVSKETYNNWGDAGRDWLDKREVTKVARAAARQVSK